MGGPGLEDWERQIIDSAALYRSAVPTALSRAFENLVRALWVLDASPTQAAAAINQLHTEIVYALNQARTEALRQARDEIPERVG